MWLGFIIGYIVAMIVGAIIEVICILLDKSELDKWMTKEKENE